MTLKNSHSVPLAPVPSSVVRPGPRAAATHILVADDDADLRMVVSEVLRMDGFRVVEARDGAELLARIADWLLYAAPDQTLDLILTDARMPEFSGVEVLEGLHRAHWRVPLIVMTAYPDVALRTTALAMGASAVIGKPFDIDELQALVLDVLSRSRFGLARRPWQRRGRTIWSV